MAGSRKQSVNAAALSGDNASQDAEVALQFRRELLESLDDQDQLDDVEDAKLLSLHGLRDPLVSHEQL